MGYAIYRVGERWGGYGVLAVCEYPDCNEDIDRGVSYACGGEPFSEYGCDRYFCGKHRRSVGIKGDGSRCRHRNDCECEWIEVCDRCAKRKPPFPYKPEHPKWIRHLLKDKSWAKWRAGNKEEVEELKKQLLK